jgi:hypothetical protein
MIIVVVEHLVLSAVDLFVSHFSHISPRGLRPCELLINKDAATGDWRFLAWRTLLE